MRKKDFHRRSRTTNGGITSRLLRGQFQSVVCRKVNTMEPRFAPSIMCPILIGRVHELTTLRLLADRAKSGQGQVALLSGEAGIGKSRLVVEVKTTAASHDFLLLQGSCFPTDHAIPYAPLLALLRSFLNSHSSALPAPAVKQAAHASLPFLPASAPFLPNVPLPPKF